MATMRKDRGQKTRLWGLAMLVLALTLALGGCGEAGDVPAGGYFLPPTLAPESSAISLATPTPTPQASPTPECVNDLDFLDDVTIPDGSVYAPGDVMEKVWLVRNAGTCNWDSRYRLKLVAGDPMGAEPVQALYPARSQSEVEFVITFIAPDEEGVYTNSWQAYDPDGEPFGDRFFIEIEVIDNTGE